LNKLIVCSLVAILMLSLIPFNINGYSTTTNNSNTSDDDNRIASVIGDSETDLEESTSSEPEYTFFVNCINGTSIELGEKDEPEEEGVGSSGVSGGNGSSSCWISTENITADDRIVELAANGSSAGEDDGSAGEDDGSAGEDDGSAGEDDENN
jgi:hypothetical protein